MKKALLFVLCFVIALGAFAAVQAQDVVEINVPTMRIGINSSAEWFAERSAAFNAEYGDRIKVNIEEIAGDQNLVDKIKVLYSANSLPSAFDLGGYNVIDMMKDQLVDLTPYIDEETRANASDICWDVNTRDGKRNISLLPASKNLLKPGKNSSKTAKN